MSLNNKQMAKNLTDKAIKTIEEQISHQIIQISSERMDIDEIIRQRQNKRQGKKLWENGIQPNLEQLNQIKQIKIMEIKEIEKQESLLKSTVLKRSKISKSCKKLWKSEFTEEQMNQIKQIKRKQKKYEKQLQNKKQNLQNWINEKQKQDDQLKKQYITEQCQQRKKQLTKQRQQLQKKKHQRQLLLQQQIKKLKQQKNKKLLYHQMAQSWKKYQQTSQSQKLKLWQLHKQKIRVNSKDIQKHGMKYLQMKKDQQKKRLQQSRALKYHLPYIHIHGEYFHKVQHEKEQREKQQEMKLKDIQNKILKKKQYSKHVTEALLQKASSKSFKNKEKDEESTKKSRLNTEEFHKLGNDYMKTAHEKITSSLIEKSKKINQISQQSGGNSMFYKNYLKDIKHECQKQNKVDISAAVQQTMKDNKLNEIEKLQKVRAIFEKDTGKKGDMQLIQIIRNKMKVLNEVMR